MLERVETEMLLQVAKAMALAARTAPKGRGVDQLAIAILEAADLQPIIAEMERIGREQGSQTFTRDASSLKSVQVALLLGTRTQPLGLKVCGYCGFAGCAACEQAGAVCAFNTGDLGIALGSAAAVAAAYHADNRIMYSLGLAAVSLQALGPDVRIAYGLPLSATSKNPFFDRK